MSVPLEWYEAEDVSREGFSGRTRSLKIETLESQKWERTGGASRNTQSIFSKKTSQKNVKN